MLRSGNVERLLADLQAPALDVVLTTEPPRAGQGGAQAQGFVAHRISEQPVGLHGVPARLCHPSVVALLAQEPVIVPTESAIRTGFDALIARLGLDPRIVADVDDMAMVRLLAREGAGVAVAPALVLADEIASGLRATAPDDLEIAESFCAVAVARNFPHPLLPGRLGAWGKRAAMPGDGPRAARYLDSP